MKFNFTSRSIDNLPPIEYRNIQPKEKTTLEKMAGIIGSTSTLFCVGYTLTAQVNNSKASYYKDRIDILPPDTGFEQRLKIVDSKNIKELRSARLEYIIDEGVTIPNNCTVNIITNHSGNEFVATAKHCIGQGEPELKTAYDTGSISYKKTEYDKDGRPYSDYVMVVPKNIFIETHPNLRITEFDQAEIKSKGITLANISLNTASCENKSSDSSYFDIGATKIIETKDIKRIFVPGNSGSLIYQYLLSKKGDKSESKSCLTGMAIEFEMGIVNNKKVVKSVTVFEPDSDPKKPWKLKTIEVKR